MAPEYRRKYTRWLDEKHRAEILQCAQKAFDQRKAALENLVKLYGMQYFAGPSEPRDLDIEKAHREKRARIRERKKVVRTRRRDSSDE